MNIYKREKMCKLKTVPVGVIEVVIFEIAKMKVLWQCTLFVSTLKKKYSGW